MSISNVFALLAGVALFLFGMSEMGDGLKKSAGNKLELILYKLSNNSIKGILLGAGVTAVIQSSSATSVMVVGFVNSGMMKVKQAIGVIMGAIIGTSITGWIICLSSVNASGIFEVLSTNTLTAIVLVVGVILLLFTAKEKNHQIAQILLGFGVLMFGIAAMTDAVYPLRESQGFINALTTFSNPVIGILIGILFTAIIQSASAAVGILQALAVTGAISFSLAFPVIMGIAIGASLPVLLSALGANANGKRTALIYLIVDALGAIVVSILFYGLNAVVHFGLMDMTMNMLSIALLNTIYRIVIVVLLSPFIGTIEKFVNDVIHDKDEFTEEMHDVDCLEERFLVHPALSIEQARIALNSMSNLSKLNLQEAIKLFESFSEKGFARAVELEGIVDKYEDKLGNYVSKIMKNELNEGQYKTVRMYLHSINDLERISDHAKNVAESSKEINDKGIVFTNDAMDEMQNLFSVIEEIITISVKALSDDSLEDARKIEPLEETIDTLCDEYKVNHINRVSEGLCQYDHGYVFNDILTDLERIGDHCSNIGIAVRMKHDDLKESHDSSLKIMG